MEKFLRCFAYGLEPGEVINTTVEGQTVEFSHDAPQVDVPVAPAEPVNPE